MMTNSLLTLRYETLAGLRPFLYIAFKLANNLNPRLERNCCTRWSKSHATHVKIFIDGCNSIQFNCINKHNTAVIIQKPTQVTSCCNLLAPVRQLSSNSRGARMSFSQVQRVFIVEHYLASRSYLTCQNEFRDTFPYSPVPNKSTAFRLVNRFRHCRNSSLGWIKYEEKSECMHRWTRWTFPTLDISFFFFLISVWFIFWQIQHVSVMFFSGHLYFAHSRRDVSTVRWLHDTSEVAATVCCACTCQLRDSSKLTPRCNHENSCFVFRSY
jgi:hypothetical protein